EAGGGVGDHYNADVAAAAGGSRRRVKVPRRPTLDGLVGRAVYDQARRFALAVPAGVEDAFDFRSRKRAVEHLDFVEAAQPIGAGHSQSADYQWTGVGEAALPHGRIKRATGGHAVHVELTSVRSSALHGSSDKVPLAVCRHGGGLVETGVRAVGHLEEEGIV